MHRRVDLLAPRLRPGVEPRHAVGPRVVVELERDQQVVLGVADQVLHDALGLRVRGVAEVGPEPVVGRRTARSPGTGPPRSRPRRPSGSPSGPRAPPSAPRRGPRSTRPASPAWWPAAHRRRTGRTGTATRPAPRRTRAPCRPATTSLAPVDDQHLARRPHRRTPTTGAGLPAPPRPLRLGDQPPEVAVRPRIARRPCRRQQPLRADPARRSSSPSAATRSATSS